MKGLEPSGTVTSMSFMTDGVAMIAQRPDRATLAEVPMAEEFDLPNCDAYD